MRRNVPCTVDGADVGWAIEGILLIWSRHAKVFIYRTFYGDPRCDECSQLDYVALAYICYNVAMFRAKL